METQIISLSASANKLSDIQKFVLEKLDPDNLGYIKRENLRILLLHQAPQQNTSQMLSQETKINVFRRWTRETTYFVLNNWQRVWVVLLWFGAMAGLFAWKYIQYRNNRSAYDVMGVCVCIANGAAETLKLNMALILLPVCRITITWLRNKTKLGVAVPFDDNLNFHTLIAVAISIGVGIHAISHLACGFPRLISATPDEYEPMAEFFGDQPKSYWHFVKSFEGMSGIIMVVLMAIAFSFASPRLRSGRANHLPKFLKKHSGFTAFWYSHHLFVIVYGLLIAHGIKLYLTKKWYKKTTWMYLMIPVVLYACERLVRVLRSSILAVKILKVAAYPANMLALHVSKPLHGFNYKSGQYMFVNCDTVSPFEWHRVSITSAPGDHHLSVHIQTLSGWTRQLKTVLFELCQPVAEPRSPMR